MVISDGAGSSTLSGTLEAGSAPAGAGGGEVLLETRQLSKDFVLSGGLVRRLGGRQAEVLHAVDRVSLTVRRGETLALVGETGSGKTTLGRLVLRLYRPTSGELLYRGNSLLRLDKAGDEQFRKTVQMIFQDPYSSLNPTMTVGSILAEALRFHRVAPRDQISARVEELLLTVGLSGNMARRKPHEFSGGQRQRIGIARALAVGPELIVADEPLSALDVSIQAQILNLLARLQDDAGLTYLFITHDLEVARHLSQRVAVMYLGELVEIGATDAIFEEPLHPYTRALVAATPKLGARRNRRPAAVRGDLPNAIERPSGCHFHPRCPYAMDVCRVEAPPRRMVAPNRDVACHLFDAHRIPVA
ncbi:MAG TPA: ABC transporter ATP-binding protein [Acidimicrobiales bacterium]|nr:ABC transporter ATP-binding protein [Acidimicrobiales bacterium]